MGYLLLSIVCSATLSITMRLSTGKIKSHFSMLSANYLICAVLGAVYSDFSLLRAQTGGIGITVGLAVLNGVILLAGLIALQVSTRKHGIVLSSLFMKLGLLVPFVMSVLFFREVPTWLQVAGFLVASGAIVLFNLKTDSQDSRFGVGLLLLLLLNGSADAIVKIFEALGPQTLSNHFLCLSFAVAFLLCACLVMGKKERPDANAYLFGALIGVANFFSFKFLLAALNTVQAVVAFPTYSVATMLVVTLSGVLFFRERLNKRQWLAFGAVIAALVMLNI